MRLIDIDKFPLLPNKLDGYLTEYERGYLDAQSNMNSLPTIDAEPVRHGHWIDVYPNIEPNPMFMYGICSKCGFEQGLSNKLNYCPNCGAKMDE